MFDLKISSTLRIDNVLCNSVVDVRRFKFNKSFSNLFCITCILESTCFEQEPKISIPYLIREYIQAKYNCLAILLVTNDFIWLNSPKNCNNDLQIFSFCLCQFSFSSRITPRYVTSLTLSISIAPTFSAQKSRGMGLLGMWNNTHLVLSWFIRSLLHRHQSYNCKKHSFDLFRNIVISAWLTKIDVSSANKRTEFSLIALHISLIYNRKNKGPKTEPCGTPQVMGCSLDFTPFTSVYWRRFVKYDLKKSFEWPLIP